MIHFTKAAIRRWLAALLHIRDSPHRTAGAYALGVFFGFSPFLGLHTVMALVCAFAFGLNRVAVLLGVYSNLPWILAPYYALATAGGATLMGISLREDFTEDLRTMFQHSPFDAEFWRSTILFKPLFWPFMLGSLLGAAMLAALAYRVALGFVRARRAQGTPAEVGSPISK